jgi:hypothetical protein
MRRTPNQPIAIFNDLKSFALELPKGICKNGGKTISTDYSLQSRDPRISLIFWYRNPGTKIGAAPVFRYQHFIHFLNKMFSQFGFVPLFFLIILLILSLHK